MDTPRFEIDDVVISHDEAEETLRAIRAGQVDGIVVNSTAGAHVFIFQNPDDAHRLLVETMAEGAALTTADGVVCYHNPRFAELLPAPDGAALVGCALRSLVADTVAPSIDVLIERSTEAPAHGEVELIGEDGQRLLIQLTISRAAVGDSTVLCVVATDLTDQRRQAELYREALVGLDARERMLSIAAHELRNPLNTLGLQLRMLHDRLDRAVAGETLDVPASIEMVERSKRQVDRLTELVGKLLDVTHLRVDRIELSPTEVRLDEIVAGVVERSLEVQDSGSAVELALSPVSARIDRIRIEQVATNLISNAAKYGLGRPIQVTVDEDDGHARIIVEDHGIGIAADQLNRLFKPFERLTTPVATTGLGLGLFIAWGIVKAHSGTMRVDSKPGGGTRFVVELPKGELPPTSG